MKKIITATLVSLMATTAIYAKGTSAGTTISNSATLSYSVGGTQQDDVQTQQADTFVVDKKIDFIVTHDDDPKHLTVAPKQQDAQRTFTLKNDGNKKQDFKIEVINLTNSEEYDSKTDTRDINNLEVSIDGGNTWTAASNDIVVDDLDVDQNVTILVRGDIPELGDDPKVSDGDVINIQLKAIAVKDGTTDAEENTGDDNGNDRKDTEDTILAEGDDIVGSDKYDGAYIAWGGYIVHTPLLSVSKDSCVLEDPVNGQSEKAKRIPGSTILYIIDVKNSSTTTDASDVNITDTLQNDLDGSTVANLKYDDGKDSCSCSNGTAYDGGTDATDADSDDQKIEVDNLTVTKDKHNCVSFEVDIK